MVKLTKRQYAVARGIGAYRANALKHRLHQQSDADIFDAQARAMLDAVSALCTETERVTEAIDVAAYEYRDAVMRASGYRINAAGCWE